MRIATLRDENDRLKALLTQTQATLSEHQAVLAASEEAWRRLSRADRAAHQIKPVIAIGAVCLRICRGWSGSSSLRARCVPVAAAR